MVSGTLHTPRDPDRSLPDEEEHTSTETEDGKLCGTGSPSASPLPGNAMIAGVQPSTSIRRVTGSFGQVESQTQGQPPLATTTLPLKNVSSTRVRMQDLHTKDFNYSRVRSKVRRNQQIDDLDEQLRQEQETSRRLRSAVSVLERKLEAAEEGRRRSNGLERAFFGHLAEAEALVLQRDRLMTPGVEETRAESLEAARNEAHERLALVIRGELEDTTATWRGNVQGGPNDEDARQTPKSQHKRSGCTRTTAEDIARNTRILAEETGRTGAGADGMCCWESESVLQAYRTAAARTVRRVSSALFGRELLAVEAAKTSAAERERMLERRAQELFDSQVSLQVEKDKMESFKANLRAEVQEAKKQLEQAREQNRQQQDMVQDAERVHSSLSWRILSMQVARDKLSLAVGERLRVIQAAVRRRVGFLPWAVERAINDLVGLCSAPGPSDGDHDGRFSSNAEKGLLLLEEASATDTSSSP